MSVKNRRKMCTMFQRTPEEKKIFEMSKNMEDIQNQLNEANHIIENYQEQLDMINIKLEELSKGTENKEGSE